MTTQQAATIAQALMCFGGHPAKRDENVGSARSHVRQQFGQWSPKAEVFMQFVARDCRTCLRSRLSVSLVVQISMRNQITLDFSACLGGRSGCDSRGCECGIRKLSKETVYPSSLLRVGHSKVDNGCCCVSNHRNPMHRTCGAIACAGQACGCDEEAGAFQRLPIASALTVFNRYPEPHEGAC